LIDQELLPFVCIVHFLCISGDKGVEERVIVGTVGSCLLTDLLLGSQDAPKTLRFLPPAPKVGRDLNDDIGSGKVNRCVAYFAEKDGIEHVAFLEEGEDVVALVLVGRPVDVWTLHAAGQDFQGKQLVRKDNDFVAFCLMQ